MANRERVRNDVVQVNMVELKSWSATIKNPYNECCYNSIRMSVCFFITHYEDNKS